jgi:hypothetical protein
MLTDAPAILVSLLAGLWLILVGIIMLFRPVWALRALAKFGSTPFLHFSELGLRMVVGFALVVAAPSSSLPDVLVPVGWFVAVSSVVLMMLPRAWHAAYATWWSERISVTAVRCLSPLALLAGGALILVLTPAGMFPVSLSERGNPGGAVSDAGAVEARVAELWIATGRYGVMLSQARGILGLKEPNGLSGVVTEDSMLEEVRAIALQQAMIGRELLADTRLTCTLIDVPIAARTLACATARDLPPGFQQPVAPEISAVLERDAALGDFVMRWWNGVCALAPEALPDEAPACAIE